MSAPSVPKEFGIVVLNYNDYESTISCVESLVACDPAPRKIVVVDNKSPNGSFEILARTLDTFPTVEVVESGFNGGYSFGNNVGIQKLRSEGFKHIVIATSDTVVESKRLLSLLAAAMSHETGVIAPQIVSNGALDNPSCERLSLRYLLDLLWVRWSMPLLGVRRRAVYLLRKVIPRAAQKADLKIDDALARNPPRRVYKLHGAFLCLTDQYLSRVGMLDDAIFLFGEEDLLAWLCLQNQLDQVLVPAAIVHHAHDSSVNMTWGDKASHFVDMHQRNSCRVLRKKIPMLPLVRAWLKGYPAET